MRIHQMEGKTQWVESKQERQQDVFKGNELTAGKSARLWPLQMDDSLTKSKFEGQNN